MAANSDSLTVQVQVPVQAKLVLLLPDGTTRPPTPEELNSLRLRSASEMSVRLRAMLKQLRDDEDDDSISALRYFVEYVTIYSHEPPEEAIEGLRARLIWDEPE
jgi:hypothetical protein